MGLDSHFIFKNGCRVEDQELFLIPMWCVYYLHIKIYISCGRSAKCVDIRRCSYNSDPDVFTDIDIAIEDGIVCYVCKWRLRYNFFFFFFFNQLDPTYIHYSLKAEGSGKLSKHHYLGIKI